jgi:hypothetical protein
MDARWIDDMMRLNTRIIAVETRLIARVTDHVAREARSQDATRVEGLLIADRKMLCRLRRLRDVMLDEIVG